MIYKHHKHTGVFFNWASPENVSGLAPPINPSTGPPLNLPSMRITKHLDFFRLLGGGPVWDSNIFLKFVTYRPILSIFRGGPVKKNTLYIRFLSFYDVFHVHALAYVDHFVMRKILAEYGNSVPTVHWPSASSNLSAGTLFF